MGQSKSIGLLAFSAMLALGPVPGWTRPAPPDRPLPPWALEQASGKADQTGADSRAAETSEEVRKSESEAEEKERRPHTPDRQEPEEETPAREEESDCDDCVIVRLEASGQPADTAAEASGRPGSGLLAGTLWGLFMVARPKRMPRTLIRGINVP